METKKYKLSILGATGFTARCVLDEIIRVYANEELSWAIIGRNEVALNKIREELTGKIKEKNLIVTPPTVVVADVSDYSSLVTAAQSSLVLLNCVGPYSSLGEPVVKACIEGGCHYLDLCGEPEFIESMTLKYSDQAQERGLTILHAAVSFSDSNHHFTLLNGRSAFWAFDSVPCDMAVLRTKRLLSSNGSIPAKVEMFFQVIAPLGLVGHYTTYQAAIDGFASAASGKLRRTRKELYTRYPRKTPFGPPVKFGKGLLGLGVVRDVGGRSGLKGAWLIPYFFSDPAVVNLSQARSPDTEPVVHFAAYIVIPNLFALVLSMIYLLIFQFLVKRPWGGNLLYKHPKVFTNGVASREGPTAAQLSATSFRQTYIGEGYSSEKAEQLRSSPTSKIQPDVRIVTRVEGPEPGYISTGVLFVICAKLILSGLEEDVCQVAKGVVTPAVAFSAQETEKRLWSGIENDGRISWWSSSLKRTA